jgi:hypothetical protein
MSNANGGYTIYTDIGIIELKTLREAALVAVACAEKGRRLDRAQRTQRMVRA